MQLRLSGFFVVSWLLLTTLASAAGWPQLENRLQHWQGDKEVQLPVGVDPLDDPQLAPVVELLLAEGFAVLTATGSTVNGLSVEVKSTRRGQLLLLKRASDGAILAMEPLPAATSEELEPPPAAAPPSLPAAGVVYPAALAASASVVALPPPPRQVACGELMFELEGQPLQVVAWSAAGSVDLYLLYDRYVQRLRCDGHSLQALERFDAPLPVSRALHLDIDDLDGDGQPELAVVWAEDVRGVADGTDSLLHSWLVSVTAAGMRAVSEDLLGYVALAQGQGRLQKRLPYQAFAPEIYPLTLEGGRVQSHAALPGTKGRWLFNQLEWPDSSRLLIWNDEQRLMLVSRSENARIPGTTLLTDFGDFQGPVVSVPLENPEYRSGFSANDRVLAVDVHLARRLLKRGDAAYTVVRGRSPGLLLVGRPTGADRIVAIRSSGHGLQADYPLAAIEAYILDFALYGGEILRAAVLVNEKADGSGSSYLRLQQQL